MNEYLLCGDCLHARSSHTQQGDSLMYCASCMKCCDLEEYMNIHEPSYSICQDGVKLQLK